MNGGEQGGRTQGDDIENRTGECDENPFGLSPAHEASFYRRDASEVARDLLGSVLVCRRDGFRAGRITETEAYLGEHDMASHARFGRTRRNQVLYGPAGRSYVYLIYGMYDMLNAVCGPEGDPQAVLIRAIDPIAGIERSSDGPGKLTRALRVDRTLNDIPLDGPLLSIHPDRACVEPLVTPRIGIDYAGEWRDAPLRFLLRDSA